MLPEQGSFQYIITFPNLNTARNACVGYQKRKPNFPPFDSNGAARAKAMPNGLVAETCRPLSSNTRHFFNLLQVAGHLYRKPKEWFGVPILEQWRDTIINLNITNKRRYVPKKEIDKP